MQFEIQEKVGEEKWWKILMILSIGLSVTLTGVSAYIYITQLSDGEWSCITEKCVEFSTGDDWVRENCVLQGNAMFCSFVYDGQDYSNVPLDAINISRMVSCKRYECSAKVFLKGGAK